MFKIYDGRENFYQWDLNQKLIVTDPTITEVHFCNRTDDCALVCEVYEDNGQRLVNVPNILLTDNWTIRAYGYCGNCYTKQDAAFKVAARSKPSDYIYTETEVKNLDELTRRLEKVEDIAQGAVGGETFLNYEELVNELNAAEQDKYYVGQHFLIKTLGVPDLWVYEVAESQEQYEYTTDEALAEGVVNSLVQIGYFVLSALETQKVDLTDYVEKIDFVVEGAQSAKGAIYWVDKDNNQGYVYVDNQNNVGMIPIRDHYGNFYVSEVYYPYHCATKQYVDNGFVAKMVGTPEDTTQGFIYGLNRDGTTAKLYTARIVGEAGTIPYRDGNGNFYVGLPKLDYHCANKKYVDDNFIAKAGAGVSNRVYGVNQAGEQVIYNVLQGQGANFIIMSDAYGCISAAAPRLDNNCATKKYVDDAIAAITDGEEVAY